MEEPDAKGEGMTYENRKVLLTAATVTNEESFNEAIGRLFDGHQGKHTN